jgi:hypothetical protein
MPYCITKSGNGYYVSNTRTGVKYSLRPVKLDVAKRLKRELEIGWRPAGESRGMQRKYKFKRFNMANQRGPDAV